MRNIIQSIWLSLVLTHSIFTTSAQTESHNFIDSIQAGLKKTPKFIFKFDTRNSFIANQSARIFGWKIGVEFGNTLRIGGGFYTLVKHSSALDKTIFDANGTDTLATAKLMFNYIAYFVDYIFYKKKKWEFSIPLQIGIGRSRYEYTGQDGSLIRLARKTVLLYEPAITGHYKVTKWFGIGMGAGFRIMLINNKALDRKFNSPIYILKIKIFLGDIYRAIAPSRSCPKGRKLEGG